LAILIGMVSVVLPALKISSFQSLKIDGIVTEIIIVISVNVLTTGSFLSQGIKKLKNN
jgi:hypothetical protein